MAPSVVLIVFMSLAAIFWFWLSSPIWAMLTFLIAIAAAVGVCFYRNIMEQIHESRRVNIAVEFPTSTPSHVVDQISFMCEQLVQVPTKGPIKLRCLIAAESAEQVIDVVEQYRGSYRMV